MKKYRIIMDVSGDIDVTYAKEHDLAFIPMEYSLGNEMRTCTGPEPDEVLKLFYDGQRNGDLTKTSQISPYMYEQYLEPYFEEGYSVLYLCLSSGLSSTYQSALTAKQSLKEKYPDQDFYPVDSLAATGGMGVLCERAFRNQEKGLSIEENYRDLVEAASHVRLWFVVQDLMYLKRGGRVSGATALVGTALNIKPILRVTEGDGRLDTISKKRGNKAAVKEVARFFAESHDPASDDVIYVLDADDKQLGNLLEQEVRALYPEAVIRRTGLSPIIGAHTGPGMAAICHMGK